MSFLTGHEILQRHIIDRTAIRDIQIQPASIDLTLSTEPFLMPRYAEDMEISLQRPPDYVRIKVHPWQGFTIRPGAFYLASVAEWVTMTSGHMGHLMGRSTLGRLGLLVHITAGLLDPGYKGKPTLELHNIGPHPIRLLPGDRICQLAVAETVGKSSLYSGRYQNAQTTEGAKKS